MTSCNSLFAEEDRFLIGYFSEITSSYYRAKKKHPDWSNYDIVHRTAKLVEEAGEVLQQANDVHEGKTICTDKYRQELLQTGAMVLRNLRELEIRSSIPTEGAITFFEC
jgi:hypothetical protein